MGERLYRTQILLEPEQHRALMEMAEREGRSISDLVREMVREQIEQRERSGDEVARRRLGAVARIRRHREEMVESRGGSMLDFDAVQTIGQMREERDERNSGGARDAGN